MSEEQKHCGFQVIHPKDGDEVPRGFVAQGTMGHGALTITGRLLLKSAPQVTYPAHVVINQTSWFMTFYGLARDSEYTLEILNECCDVIACVEIKTGGAFGTNIYFPRNDQSPAVCETFYAYGVTTEPDSVPLECVKACDTHDCSSSGNSYDGEIEFRNNFFWTAKFPKTGTLPAGTYWVKVGKKPDCTDADTAERVPVIQCK